MNMKNTSRRHRADSWKRSHRKRLKGKARSRRRWNDRTNNHARTSGFQGGVKVSSLSLSLSLSFSLSLSLSLSSILCWLYIFLQTHFFLSFSVLCLTYIYKGEVTKTWGWLLTGNIITPLMFSVRVTLHIYPHFPEWLFVNRFTWWYGYRRRNGNSFSWFQIL